MTAPTEPLTGAVELLDRALGYTRVVLAGVDDADLRRPTPCDDWDLGALLAHMEDALDAFTEAAGGRVGRAEPVDLGARPRVDRLQQKACSLLGAWSAATSDAGPEVDVGGHPLAADLLVAAAALEVTVHGWDVGQALGAAPPLPDGLAERLLDLALVLVQPEDRVVRFAAARPLAPGAAPGERLLAHLGR